MQIDLRQNWEESPLVALTTFLSPTLQCKDSHSSPLLNKATLRCSHEQQPTLWCHGFLPSLQNLPVLTWILLPWHLSKQLIYLIWSLDFLGAPSTVRVMILCTCAKVFKIKSHSSVIPPDNLDNSSVDSTQTSQWCKGFRHCCNSLVQILRGVGWDYFQSPSIRASLPIHHSDHDQGWWPK